MTQTIPSAGRWGHELQAARRLPPFGVGLVARFRSGNLPAAVLITAGAGARERAKNPTAKGGDWAPLVLPDAVDPHAMRWPVAGLTCIIERGEGPGDAVVVALIEALLRGGAARVAVFMERLARARLCLWPRRKAARLHCGRDPRGLERTGGSMNMPSAVKIPAAEYPAPQSLPAEFAEEVKQQLAETQAVEMAEEDVVILDDAPPTITRLLSLVNGHAYAVTWVPECRPFFAIPEMSPSDFRSENGRQ